MLLTIRTTYRPATDLGFLLHKHPDHVHTREFPFGSATVFYPEAAEDACTAAVLLDVDQVRPPLPVRQVRRRRRSRSRALSAGAHRVPTFIFSAWLQQSTLVPVRWAVEDAMTWRGIGLSGAGVSALVLIGFAAAFSFIAVSRFGGKGLTKS